MRSGVRAQRSALVVRAEASGGDKPKDANDFALVRQQRMIYVHIDVCCTSLGLWLPELRLCPCTL